MPVSVIAIVFSAMSLNVLEHTQTLLCSRTAVDQQDQTPAETQHVMLHEVRYPVLDHFLVR